MRTTIASSAAFRRTMLLMALALVAAEVLLFGLAWRLGLLLEPGSDPRAAMAFVLLGSVLTVQAMAVVGMAWLLVALSRTTATFDEDVLALEHPWREWSGGWGDVRHAWVRGGWLTIEVAGTARRWHVRPEGGAGTLGALRAHLGGSAWLDGAALRRHLVYRVLPVPLALAGLGGFALVLLLRYLPSLLG
jgi:hypothetical protein